ncbi:collagen alpha-1(III) chain-like [Eublepharis macularius]|uniref:Collagen alpha-1(III) chain-like n=1 Tax=Eublepharis macularius TaxID=481883 RepID=A0AA97KEJ9_EUBMA|nr:collagen alpha-1(III) chain-like [Eublepharis macularius]
MKPNWPCLAAALSKPAPSRQLWPSPPCPACRSPPRAPSAACLPARQPLSKRCNACSPTEGGLGLLGRGAPGPRMPHGEGAERQRQGGAPGGRLGGPACLPGGAAQRTACPPPCLAPNRCTSLEPPPRHLQDPSRPSRADLPGGTTGEATRPRLRPPAPSKACRRGQASPPPPRRAPSPRREFRRRRRPRWPSLPSPAPAGRAGSGRRGSPARIRRRPRFAARGQQERAGGGGRDGGATPARPAGPSQPGRGGSAQDPPAEQRPRQLRPSPEAAAAAPLAPPPPGLQLPQGPPAATPPAAQAPPPPPGWEGGAAAAEPEQEQGPPRAPPLGGMEAPNGRPATPHSPGARQREERGAGCARRSRREEPRWRRRGQRGAEGRGLAGRSPLLPTPALWPCAERDEPRAVPEPLLAESPGRTGDAGAPRLAGLCAAAPRPRPFAVRRESRRERRGIEETEERARRVRLRAAGTGPNPPPEPGPGQSSPQAPGERQPQTRRSWPGLGRRPEGRSSSRGAGGAGHGSPGREEGREGGTGRARRGESREPSCRARVPGAPLPASCPPCVLAEAGSGPGRAPAPFPCDFPCWAVSAEGPPRQRGSCRAPRPLTYFEV